MISLKKVTTKDSPYILHWRNDKYSRRYSGNQKIISKEEHRFWLSNELKNKKNILLVARKNNIRVGFIRYNFLESNIYEVSINLNPKYRNKGIGEIFILKSENFLSKNCLIYANVKKNNKISNLFFKKVDYTMIKSGKSINIFCKIHNQENHKKSKYFEEIISQIEDVRKNNNVNWMDILRLAFDKSPLKARAIFKKVFQDDKKINKLSKKISTFK